MKHEYLLLLKQRYVWIMLAISMALTWFSLHNGWQNITHIEDEIAQSQHHERERLIREQSFYAERGDAGEVGYFVFHNVYQHPQEWSFLALGNRLVTPYMQRMRLLGLQGQLYDGESHHPEYVMLGAFDYAFWLVFCAPLICIALLHGLKAGEYQAQRLDFLHGLAKNPAMLWRKRVFARWSMIALSLVLPFTLFVLWQGLALGTALKVIGMTLLYTLFWTAICAAVSLRRRGNNASLNAILLVSAWLLLSVVLPNLGQLWIHQRYPVQEGSQLALHHRELVHGAWDLPKAVTLDPFYQLYPQWKDTPPVIGRFHWKWYYAFQHMADVRLADQVEQREDALLQRNTAVEKFSWVLPTLYVQRALESIAGSDVAHLVAHRRRITEYHTELRHYFYPYFFEEQRFGAADFANMPAFSGERQPKPGLD